MKDLLMIRHSKTEMMADSDMERELTEKGMADSVILGRMFNESGITADIIVSSPAARAQKTAQLIARGIKYPENAIVTDKLLYHAAPEEIVSFIQHFDKDIKSLIIVGHNPIILEAINLLGNKRVARLKTSHAVKFQFDTDSWEDVCPDTCSHMVKIF
jgi:phosphohistidine phosphatase